MGGIMGVLALIGGVLIAIAQAWGVVTNRRRSAGERRRTEAATHDLYRTMDKQDQASDPDPKSF